ncbi:hypothetical protein DAPPUDRAFT_269226 [Daphnia pulex]|uniref:Uncharacterized protein n=1 Tax=Daphnia pulex TaxID=6669 RepID=E9HZ15_DAPPU|nr:hypothetical protein DAPPUDRAFT_269226 [Daphnia pulex]|eukprot:EFX63015.1 hypothetical protein DAPPUDRAFT_269226 [Daphnia pulex]
MLQYQGHWAIGESKFSSSTSVALPSSESSFRSRSCQSHCSTFSDPPFFRSYPRSRITFDIPSGKTTVSPQKMRRIEGMKNSPLGSVYPKEVGDDH